MILSILISAVWYSSSGQDEVYSLERCIDYAMTHGSGILLAEAGVRSSREQLLCSELDLLPTLNLYVNQYFNWGRSVDMQELVIVRNRLTQQTSGSVGASFSLFDGFARINTVAANRALVAAARGDAALAAVQLKADITRAYLAATLARITADRLTESHLSIVKQATRVRREVDSGTREKSDLLELEAKAADLAVRMAEASGEQEFQMVQLYTLMGCGECIEIDTDLAQSCPQPRDCTPPETAPQIATAAGRSRVRAAEYALKAARGAMLPSVSLSAAYGTYYSDASGESFTAQIDGNRNPSVSLSLAIPIFNGGAQLAAIARARADLEAERLRLRQAEEKAYSEFLQICQQAATLRCQERSCRIRCELCRERFNSSSARYEQGAISTSDYLEACEDLAQSECELAQCRCKYLFQLKIIDYYRDGCQ